MKVLFLTPYPTGEAPSQRFRFEQYFPLLETQSIQIETQSFVSVKVWKRMYSHQDIFQVALMIIIGFLKRFFILFKVRGFDFIFIHREAAPVGPPVIEWIISKVLNRKIIYDFDDAIWLTDKAAESWLEKKIKWRGKVAAICRWSYQVSCGNNFLCDYAKAFSASVVLNPTTIDTQLHNPLRYPKKNIQDDQITIGWTGSHSTLKYLNEIITVIQELEIIFPLLKFVVIANQRPTIPLKSMKFKPWKKETEIEDLQEIDIGIMPLPDDQWARGKCGFKALQYMALEIPTIASPVGVNSSIIQHEINGFLCSTSREWFTMLEKLMRNPVLRKEIGHKGRQKVLDEYSVCSNSSTFLSFFQKL